MVIGLLTVHMRFFMSYYVFWTWPSNDCGYYSLYCISPSLWAVPQPWNWPSLACTFCPAFMNEKILLSFKVFVFFVFFNKRHFSIWNNRNIMHRFAVWLKKAKWFWILHERWDVTHRAVVTFKMISYLHSPVISFLELSSSLSSIFLYLMKFWI